MNRLLNLERTFSLKSSKQGLGTSWQSWCQLLPAAVHSALHSSSAPLVTEFEPWSATVSDSYG